jgi:hypothetical protein
MLIEIASLESVSKMRSHMLHLYTARNILCWELYCVLNLPTSITTRISRPLYLKLLMVAYLLP